MNNLCNANKTKSLKIVLKAKNCIQIFVVWIYISFIDHIVIYHRRTIYKLLIVVTIIEFLSPSECVFWSKTCLIYWMSISLLPYDISGYVMRVLGDRLIDLCHESISCCGNPLCNNLSIWFEQKIQLGGIFKMGVYFEYLNDNGELDSKISYIVFYHYHYFLACKISTIRTRDLRYRM